MLVLELGRQVLRWSRRPQFAQMALFLPFPYIFLATLAPGHHQHGPFYQGNELQGTVMRWKEMIL